jgi:hypothetical protein
MKSQRMASKTNNLTAADRCIPVGPIGRYAIYNPVLKWGLRFEFWPLPRGARDFSNTGFSVFRKDSEGQTSYSCFVYLKYHKLTIKGTA